MKTTAGLKAYEKILITVSVAGIIGLSYLLSRADQFLVGFAVSSGQGEPVGAIIQASNDVRRRLRTSFSWYPSYIDDFLYEFDSVYTGPASEAHIELLGQSTVRILENSLVVLQMKQDELLLNLQGGASIDLIQGSEIKLASRNRVIKVGPAVKDEKVAVQTTSDGSLRISTKAKELKIKVDDKEESISEDDILYLDQAKDLQIQKKKVNLLSPQKEQKVWLSESNNSIDFNYDLKVKSGEFRIQVSKDLNFSNVIYDSSLQKGGQHKAMIEEVKEGQYHWRIIDGQENANAAMTNTFTVARINPVELSFPASGTEINTEKQGAARIRFRWQAKAGVEYYNIQVADPRQNGKVIVNETTESSQFVSPVLQPGKYSWRIRPVGDSPVQGLWSEASEFYLNRTKPLLQLTQRSATRGEPIYFGGPRLMPMDSVPVSTESMPMVAKPETLRVLKFPEEEDGRTPSSEVAAINPPKLEWIPVKESDTYEVQVSDDPDFRNIIWKDETDDTRITWPEVRSGEYYWRVRGKGGEFSAPPGKIKAYLPPPELPEGDLDVVQSYKTLKILNESPAKVKLEWTPVPTAQGYNVFLSQNEDFRGKTKKFKTREPQAEIDLEKEGTFYAKVAAVGKRGLKYSQSSDPKKISLRKTLVLKTPGVIGPVNATSVVAFNLKQTQPLAFVWNKVKEANEYELQFAKDPEFGEITDRKALIKNQFILKDIKAGKTFWRVRSRYGKHKSPWSQTYFFDVQVPE